MDANAYRYVSRLSAAAMMATCLQPIGRDAAAHEIPGGPGQPPTHIECRCRANGRTFGLGEKVCLQTPAGYRLAECRMVQNVTSWSVAKEDCMVNARLDALADAPRPGKAAPLIRP
jgi:hypothetical protein